MKLKIKAGLVTIFSVFVMTPLNANATATSAHFVPSSFSAIKDPSSGRLVLQAQVAGLGNKGIAIINATGSVTVSMICVNSSNRPRTISSREVRVNEHNIQSDRNGNYKVYEELNAPTACPSGTTLLSGSRTVTWDNIRLSLLDDVNRNVIDTLYISGSI